MLKYTGLPDTIPERDFKLMLYVYGFTVIPDPKYFNGGFYAFSEGVGLGGRPNEYYMPTKAVIANPYKQFNATLTIDDECIVIPNDSLYMGILDGLMYYVSLLVENIISLRLATINTRISREISTSDDNVYKKAELYLKKIEDGELAILSDSDFFGKINLSKNEFDPRIIDLIEEHQYLKSCIFNEICLHSTFNMKRENLNKSEVDVDVVTVFPKIEDMLNTQRTAFEKLKRYGLDIKVDLNPLWDFQLTGKDGGNNGEKELSVD